MRKLVAVALAVGALVGSQLNATRNSDEKCFAEKINFERTSRNIPALKANDQMDMIAMVHSDEMAARETIFHSEDLPDEPGVRPFAAVGENVGMGSDCPTLHAAFMDSPGHRANILDRDYSELGVGVTKRDDTIYATMIFLDRPNSEPTKPPGQPPSEKPPTPRCTCPS